MIPKYVLTIACFLIYVDRVACETFTLVAAQGIHTFLWTVSILHQTLVVIWIKQREERPKLFKQILLSKLATSRFTRHEVLLLQNDHILCNLLNLCVFFLKIRHMYEITRLCLKNTIIFCPNCWGKLNHGFIYLSTWYCPCVNHIRWHMRSGMIHEYWHRVVNSRLSSQCTHLHLSTYNTTADVESFVTIEYTCVQAI